MANGNERQIVTPPTPMKITQIAVVVRDIEAALKTWTSARLERAMAELAEAALEARRQSAMAELIAQRALLALAIKARRKE